MTAPGVRDGYCDWCGAWIEIPHRLDGGDFCSRKCVREARQQRASAPETKEYEL